jgi:hypothetical protein
VDEEGLSYSYTYGSQTLAGEKIRTGF